MGNKVIQTQINGGLTITEYAEGIRFGTDAILLSAFAKERIGKGECYDFGTGSGILPLLLLAAGCSCHFHAIELQEKYAGLAENNVADNGFSERVTVVHHDLRQYKSFIKAGSASYVISNPPYLPAECGRKNLAEEKRIAWHDDSLHVDELAAAAGWALKTGGKFFCIYLPDRLSSLCSALHACGLEPKRIRLIAPSLSEKPSLVLLEAKKDAAEGLQMEPIFPIYTNETHTEESSVLKETYRIFNHRGD